MAAEEADVRASPWAPGRRPATIEVGDLPLRVAVSPDGRRGHVANHLVGTVSVIDIG